jgi:hypothetical protein
MDEWANGAISHQPSAMYNPGASHLLIEEPDVDFRHEVD